MDLKILPIGTVVLLKDSEQPIIIGGYLSVSRNAPNKVWDYSGFPYPAGYSSNEDIYCFDSSQINTVIACGYIDIQEMGFAKKIEELRTEIEKKINKEEG